MQITDLPRKIARRSFAARWVRLAILAAATTFLVAQINRLPPDVDLRRAGDAAMELAAVKTAPARESVRGRWNRWLGRQPSSPLQGPRIQVATLDISFRHRLAAGFVNVWVDDNLVLKEAVEVGVLGLVFGKTLQRQVPVLPGKHRLEVQISAISMRKDVRETVYGDFAAGSRRRLLVKLPPGYRELEATLQ